MIEALLMKGRRALNPQAYTDFLQWITQKGYPQNAINQSPNYGSRYYADFTTQGGTMWGTSYGGYFTYDSILTRTIQHALPTMEIYTDYRDNRRRCVFRNVYAGAPSSFTSLNRNDYVSSNYGSFGGLYMEELIYWDEGIQQVMSYNPFRLTTPEPFELV